MADKSNLDDLLAQLGEVQKKLSQVQEPEGDLLRRMKAIIDDADFNGRLLALSAMADLLPDDSQVKPNIKNGVMALAGCGLVAKQRLTQLAAADAA